VSRIHDALKKAEEQRLGNLGSSRESLPANQPALAEYGTEFAAPMPIYAPAANVLDTPNVGNHLLEQCVHRAWSPGKDALFITSDEDHSPGLEEFRRLRSKLFQLRASKPLKTILISSAMPGEGKSFVAANLAQAFARQRGGRTLLIDADLRRPHAHEILGAPSSPGLQDFLSGKASEKDIIQRSNYDDLFFIPAGIANSTAPELLGSGRLKTLLQTVAPLFSWIVIDSSPVVPVTDPTRIAELVDGVLLVVRAASTPQFLAVRAKREFQSAPILGVVLNRVASKENPYYKYSSYGYAGHNKSE
jgi:protein-tyrosine kinase